MGKPKPPVSAWIVSQRKLKTWKPLDLARELRTRGVRAEEGTVRTWEAGRKPSAEAIAEMERLFGSAAPQETEGDLADAIRAQTAAMLELVAELRAAREAQQGRDEGLAVSLDALAESLELLRPALNGTSRRNNG